MKNPNSWPSSQAVKKMHKNKDDKKLQRLFVDGEILTAEDWAELEKLFENLPNEFTAKFTTTEIKVLLFMMLRNINRITKIYSIPQIAKKINVSPKEAELALHMVSKKLSKKLSK